jgi:6-phosphogluconolactonase
MAMLRAFPSREKASVALASSIASALRAAVAGAGRASAVVSGGQSPRDLFRLLRSMPVPWPRISVVPSDERWVDTDDDASNEQMIRNELFAGSAEAADLVSLYRPGLTAEQALPTLAAALAEVKRPFDVVVLGLGDDGHTASLFPDAPDLAEALTSDALVVVQRLPRLPHARVSLTPRALLDARRLYLLFFGDVKRAVYERAVRAGPAEELPVRAIIHQTRVPVAAFWAR